MLVWLISTGAVVGDSVDTSGSDAEKAGAAIGGGIAFTFIVGIWLIGAVITGLLALITRSGKTVTVTK